MTRGTRPLGYQPGLDGVRALAALLVVVGHAGFLPRSSMVGMPLFFALSGFLITRLLIDERAATGTVSLRGFYWRRARRLGPALAVVLLAVAIAGSVDAVSWLASIAYVKNWHAALAYQLDAVLHTWSLAVEEQFYLLWPLAFLLLRPTRRTALLLLVAAAASMMLRSIEFGALGYERAYYGSDTRADALLLGCAAAIASASGWRPSVTLTAVCAAVLALGSLVPLTVPDAFWLTIGLSVAGVAAAVVVAGAVDRGGPLAWRPLVFVGLVSYGMYLWHWPVMLWLGRPEGGVLGAVAVGLSFALAIASWRFVERPFRHATLPGWLRLRSHQSPGNLT